MHRLHQIWRSLRASFWFVPTLTVAISGVLAIVLVEIDSSRNDDWLAQWPRLFGATPEGARQTLATIASSIVTVMGVTFSMTLVALALASSQYTSRVLRIFMADRVTQSTLGIFAGIFTYCLIVLHTIRSGDDQRAFVPGVALFFAFVLAIGGVGIFVYFIHHIATSIQASTILASVTEETIAAIDRLFPPKPGPAHDENDDPVAKSLDAMTWHPVPAKTYGYIQDVDHAALERLAKRTQTIVRMEAGVGEFVVQGNALASLSQNAAPDRATVDALNAAYDIRSHRTVDSDPAFGIRQIVDMALKALSPGVNDTSTASMCIDYLSAILTRLATRTFPALRRHDGDALRVVTMAPTFPSLLGSAFDQIRRNAEGNVTVIARMLGGLAAIASQVDKPDRRLALSEQVRRIAELVDRTIAPAHDREHIEALLVRTRVAIDAGPAA